ncbi:class I SAM-dependent methyltransferase [Candidatus Zixiibacteriota bacterium]
MNSLSDILKNLNGGKILDVATGHGEFLKHLAKLFKQYDEGIGIDLQIDRINLADKEKSDNIRFEKMSGDDIKFDAASFDTVAIRHSLHHLDNIERVLSEMYRVLKPDGLFIICEVFQKPETEKENSQRHVHHWWAAVDTLNSVPHFETITPDEIQKLISRINLKIEHNFEFTDDFPEDQMDEVVEFMNKKIDEYIGKLEKLGNQDALIEKGQQIKETYQSQGITNEGAVYIIGRKV